MGTTTTTNARDTALASVPPEKRETLLTKGSDLGVHGADDVIWSIVASVINATTAAQAAGEAAARVKTAVQGIPAAIHDGAAKASADVRASIETAIRGTINTAVSSAAQAGADALRQAAKDLPAVARAEQGRIVQEWRSALASAARDSAFAGFFQRLSVNVAVLAIFVGGIFIGGAISGAAGVKYILVTQHRLVPSTWRLLVNQKGRPECGTLAGHMVCLARKARPRT